MPSRALTRITGRPWLTTQEQLAEILEVANREKSDTDLAAQIRAERENRLAAVAIRAGRPLDNTESVTVRDGVAIVPVIGPIFRYASFFSRVSGATAVEDLARDFQATLSDPSVRAILLELDSPGGEATGVNEFADIIYAARGTKPIVAYVGGMAASAGYWIASAAEEIIIDATADLGSIGVVIALPNPEARAARQIEIVSSQSPNKRPDVSTEKGRAQYQQLVDSLADVFVAKVARNRNVSVETVLADFGQGGLFVGQAAIDAGLADRLGSFEATLSELAKSGAQHPYRSPSRSHAALSPKETESMDFKSFWSGLFAAAKEAEQAEASEPAVIRVQAEDIRADQLASIGTPAGIITSSTLIVGPAVDAAAVAAENEQLKAKLAELEQAQAAHVAQARTQAAEAFADAQISAGKAFPAEREALVAAHQVCATAGTLDSLTAIYAARPSNGVTTEVIPQDAKVVALTQPASGEMSEDRKQELLNATAEGRAALAAKAAS